MIEKTQSSRPCDPVITKVVFTNEATFHLYFEQFLVCSAPIGILTVHLISSFGTLSSTAYSQHFPGNHINHLRTLLLHRLLKRTQCRKQICKAGSYAGNRLKRCSNPANPSPDFPQSSRWSFIDRITRRDCAGNDSSCIRCCSCTGCRVTRQA